MTVLRLCIILALLTLAAHQVSADALDNCRDTTQGGLNQCADEAWRKSDAELNELYRNILTALKSEPAKAKLFTTAQRSWITFRDAQCKFEIAATEGGTMQPMLDALCRRDLTDVRVKDFKILLSCEGEPCSVPHQSDH